jgi:CheY-like chemotaxis protein
MTGQAKDADLVVVLRALFADADDAMAIVAAAPDPAMLANAEEEGPPILMVNAAMMRLTERLPKDLVGRGCMTLLDAITEPAATDKLVAALNGDTALRVDVWTRRLGGVPVASRWEVMPVRDESGAITQRIVIIHDMTEQRLAEQALSDIKAMTRKAGHDLNNMITGLIVNLSLLNGAGFSDQQRESCLTDALDAARDGARTTRQLLDAINGRAAFDMEAIEEYQEAVAASRETEDSAKPRVYRDTSPARSVKERFTSEDGDRGALLVLDDDEKLLRMMSGFLEHAGYTVSATTDPKDAISLYREMMADGRCYDLVILDLSIDERKQGLATLEAMQAIDPDVRAIAHSGHAFADVMTNPRAHGFLAAVQKPTPLSELAALIDALLKAAP